MPADDALRADLGRMTARLYHRLVLLELAVSHLSEQLMWLRTDLERIKPTASAGAGAERS